MRKDEERIKMSEELHNGTQCAPVEKNMQESQQEDAAKEPSGLCWI
jgi:hypothetical protein